MDIKTMQQSRKRHSWAVQQPDSFQEEAVFHSGGSRPDAAQPPAWGEGAKQSMCRVGGVSHDAGSSVSAFFVQTLLPSAVPSSLPQCSCSTRLWCRRSVYTLHCTSVEGAEDVWVQPHPLQLPQIIQALLSLSTRLIVFSHQVRVLEWCTPKYLMLGTTSTAVPLMWTGGGVAALVFRMSTIISFVLLLLSVRLFSLHHCPSLSTSCLYADSSPLVISPTTAILSANFTMRLLSQCALQSWVSRV